MSSPHLSNSGSSRSVGGAEDQDRLLDEANKNVKRNAFFMKKAIDEGNMKDVLKFSGEMVAELRTGALSPQNYYDLYISVTDELRHLDNYFEEVHVAADLKSGLYETVQQIGFIIPRLYLLITVGSVYIRTKTSPAMDILFDLVQLCKGVQHPTRGLFLRSYLTQCSKDNLPDVTSSTKALEPSEQKPIKDAIEYVLQNFAEVNKLWVRMQHQGANRDRAKRERERQNLRMLAGTNLVRLSQLESIDLLAYKDIVLPRVLEQIINCKDKIAQEYLMDCLIQVFPDDYHLATLETFLSSCSQLQSNVNTKEVMISMMNRLSQYSLQNPSSVPDDLEMFAMFRESSKSVIQTRPDMPIQDVLSLQVALVNFACKVYPERLSYVDDVLQFSSSVLQGSAVKTAPPKSVRHVVKLLTIPLETISVKVLDLAHYASVLKYLDYPNRRQVANAIVLSVLESSVTLNDSNKLSTLFDYIAPLLCDIDESSKEAEPDMDFQQEQHDLAKMIHLIYHQNTDYHYQLLLFVKKQISNRTSDNLSYTVPSLTFELLRLVPRVFEREQREDRDQTVNSRTVFKTIHQAISSITTTSPQLAVRLFLAASQAADKCAFEEICYEFMTQAFVTYEEEIANSKEQYAAIVLFSGTVQQLSSVGEESYKTLSTKVAQHAARLLKKGDQVRALCLCTHMFFTSKNAGPSKGETVFSTLQRAIKVSNNVLDPKEQAELLIEILDHMVYFFEKEVTEVSADRVKTVVELVQEHLADLEDGKATKIVKNQFSQIMNRIKTRTSVADYCQSHEINVA